MRIVGLIPLRGGSQRIIKKNLREIAGKPLAFWICSAAVKSKSLDAVYVSTESSEIREVVQGFGLGIEVLDRPFEFATESATTDSVLMHFKEHGPFDIVVTLQATSPLTTPDDIDRAVSQLLRDGNDSLLSGTITQRFYWSFDGRPLNYDYERRPRSQDFTGSFMENGALYVTRREILERFSNRLGGSIGLFVMSSDCAVELDESSDWPVVERLLLGTRNYLAIVVPRIQIVFMDFDGVWTDNMVSLNSSGEESLRFSKSDSLGLDRFRDSSSLPVLVISKERNEIVVQRCRKLGLEVVHGVADKPKVIESFLRDRGLTWKSVGYIGNDVNDLSAMKQAELSFCPSDSPAVVKSAATYILNNAGGNGAVREFFDLLIEFGGSKGPR